MYEVEPGIPCAMLPDEDFDLFMEDAIREWRKQTVCVRLDVYVAAAEVRYGFVHSTIVSFWGDWECVPTRADLWVAWQLMDSGIIGICLIRFFIAFH